MNAVMERLQAKAKSVAATVVFPEGDDLRVLPAAVLLAQQGVVRPIVVGQAERITAAARRVGVDLADSIEFADPASSRDLAAFADELYRLRGHKGLTPHEASRLAADPVYFGALMVRTGRADGCVAGAAHPTSHILQAALHVIGLAPSARTLSSAFLMLLPDGSTLTYADCAVVPDPDAAQLADIAIAAAQTHEQLTGEPPVVAMLSFSTRGSADHERARKVRDATLLARQRMPSLVIDGELQFDAACSEAVGRRKAPGSAVAGRANVLVFPNLDAGNIAYKITERLANAAAVGPILQGLARPMHDLSRGCSVEDVVNVARICAVQAGARRGSPPHSS